MHTRSHLKNKNHFFSGYANHTRKKFIIFCFISLFIHCLFFLGFVVLHDFELSKPLPRVIQVDLVSFVPGPAGGQGDLLSSPDLTEPDSLMELDPLTEPNKTITPESVKIPLEPAKAIIAEPDKAIQEPVTTLKPDISLKTKPKNLKDMMAAQEKKEKNPNKKKPIKRLKAKPKVSPEEALQKAREELAKKVEEENQKQISQALSRMQSAIKDQEKENPKKNNSGHKDAQGIGPGAGTGTGMGKQGYDPIDLYKMLLQSAIEQNWVFNDMLAKMDQNFEVRVLIKILKSGEIRDTTYETRSGNRYLDESAKKAINKANPLPELPKGMKSYDVVVIFTPKGLK
jgi:colicin import membrane protein